LTRDVLLWSCVVALALALALAAIGLSISLYEEKENFSAVGRLGVLGEAGAGCSVLPSNPEATLDLRFVGAA
jgi:hypothetical protein